MTPVNTLDLIGLLASLFALVFLLRGRRRAIGRDVKIILAGLLALTSINQCLNLMNWSELNLTVARLEDYSQVLMPVLWCFFIYVYAQDVGNRKLRESERRFRQLADNIREVFWLTAWPENRVLFVSSAYEAIWGRTAEDLHKNPNSWLEAVHPDDRQRVAESFIKEVAKGGFNEEYRIVHGDGSIRWIRDRGFPVRNAKGQVWRIAGIAEDITESKQALAARALSELERQRAEEKLRDYSVELRTLSRQLMDAQEAERHHIARELHDQVGQDLTALIISLQSCKQSLDKVVPAAHFEEVIHLVERVLQTVRDLSLELRPSMLDDLGLVAALRWYLDRQAQRAGFSAHFSAEPPDLRLSPELETACFRVAQEALTNVARHAKAQEVQVDLKQRERKLELTIRDDGIGFDVVSVRERAARGSSMGLLGIQERVSLLGGEMETMSVPGRGTEIRVRFPLIPLASELGKGSQA